MKKIFSIAMLALCGAFMLTSCDKDLDSNPTLVENPKDFTLNTPVIANGVDLENTATLNLTWSQPVFTTPDAPVVVNYEVQISPKNSFTKAWDYALEAEQNAGADYAVYSESFTVCQAALNTEEVEKIIQRINGWEGAEDLSLSQNLTIRVVACVKNASFDVLSSVTSNTITMNVVPYYVLLSVADPEIWYLLGSDICDGSWGSDIPTKALPMQPAQDATFNSSTGRGIITWTGYLAGNGFKIRGNLENWDEQIGQGSEFGKFLKNDGGSGNIVVNTPGVYTITIDTEALAKIANGDDCSECVTIQAYSETPDVFQSMCVSGDFNGWGDTQMYPVHTCAGAENHDWYITIELDGKQGIKFKEEGSWSYNTGGASIKLADGSSFYGYGSNGGDNLYPDAGEYLVIYNDITRYYHFVLQK